MWSRPRSGLHAAAALGRRAVRAERPAGGRGALLAGAIVALTGAGSAIAGPPAARQDADAQAAAGAGRAESGEAGARGRPTARAPGLQVGLYEVAESLTALPTIREGELPNAITAVPTLDLRGERGDFGGMSGSFVTLAEGFLTVTTPGMHQFRLISDDGSKLWIDGRLVIDHDGLHGPDGRDGEVELSAGEHALRVMHFEAGGDERLTLLWRPPDAAPQSPYEVIPAERLTHEPLAGERTAPGAKRVILPLRRGLPGDGTEVAGTNPGFFDWTADDWTGREQERDAGRRALEQYARANAAAIPGGVVLRCWRGERAADGAQLRRVVESDPNAIELVAWLPAETGLDEPGAPCTLRDGPLAGQVLVPDRRTGVIHRVFVDRIEQSDQRPVVQGCVFRFSGRRPVGIEALAATNDGGAFVGCRGFASAPADAEPSTVQRIGRGEAPAFEMLAVRALSNGLEIEFTGALDPRVGWEAESYLVEQWPYYADKGERRPQRDGTRTPVRSASVSPDRRRVFLEIPTLEADRVVYLRLLPPCASERGEKPWSTEAWYTMVRKPVDREGKPMAPPPTEVQNVLTEAEKAAGWKLLFDGQTTAGWRGWKRDDVPAGWQVVDGCLTRVGPGGDIITVGEFDDFELALEWRISQGGNSGIFFRVSEAPPNRYVWETGPEMQVLDDAEHADGRNPLTSAGSNYGLHAPSRREAVGPVGLFNRVRIVAVGPHVEYWLNGHKVVEYELGSPEWEKLVAASKFAGMPRYGRMARGHIALQDHGDRVWYRNIKVRALAPRPPGD